MSFFKKITNKLTAPEAKVQLQLSGYSVPVGENLTGNITIASKEEFDATEIRCEVQCIQQAKAIRYIYDASLKRNTLREVDETATIFSAKPILNGPIHISQGEMRDFPLNINIPAGSQPTYVGVDRRITWNVKGVVAVDGRPDATTKIADIQVITPAAQPVIKEKEIIRQIILIPCKFCGTLMDQTTIMCSNCGAKRTI
jgi:sporulation-control protein spo0M